MPGYSFTLKRGDQVLQSIDNVPLHDPADAWGFIEALSRRFPSPGLRVIVKDRDGDIVIMAGLTGLDRSSPQIAA
jgi:hypothetical protein